MNGIVLFDNQKIYFNNYFNRCYIVSVNSNYSAVANIVIMVKKCYKRKS